MINKIQVLIVIAVASVVLFSCSEDTPDCPTLMCVVAGGWQLTEAHLDNVKDNSDLSQFRLTLSMPSSATATTSAFSRIQVSGNSDSGVWSLANNETVLRLIPYNDPSLTEDWIIESITSNKMVLIIHRDVSIKQGPDKIELVLKSF